MLVSSDRILNSPQGPNHRSGISFLDLSYFCFIMNDDLEAESDGDIVLRSPGSISVSSSPSSTSVLCFYRESFSLFGLLDPSLSVEDSRTGSLHWR